MHQVKIKVVHAAGLQLTFKEGTDVLLTLEIRIGQLVGQKEFAPVMTLCHAVPYGRLGLPADIAVSGVEVVEAGGDEGIRHAAEFIFVYLAVLHGQTHAAKAEVAMDFREKGILNHVFSSSLAAIGSFAAAAFQMDAFDQSTLLFRCAYLTERCCTPDFFFLFSVILPG